MSTNCTTKTTRTGSHFVDRLTEFAKQPTCITFQCPEARVNQRVAVATRRTTTRDKCVAMTTCTRGVSNGGTRKRDSPAVVPVCMTSTGRHVAGTRGRWRRGSVLAGRTASRNMTVAGVSN